MSGIEVRRMAAADEGPVGDILGLAFADQPNTLAVTRGNVALARRIAFQGMRVATLGRTHKNLWVAEDTERGGKVVGRPSPWSPQEPVRLSASRSRVPGADR